MELIALLSDRDEIIAGVKRSLRGYAVYPLRSRGELEELLINMPINLLIVDTLSFRPSQAEEIIQYFDRDAVILITHENFNKERLSWISNIVNIKSIPEELLGVVERMIEKKRYQDKIDILSTISRKHPAGPSFHDVTEIIESPGGRLLHEQVLINFAKTLTASFDIKKLFIHFMDSVMEIARVSKMSIILKEKNVFTIRAYRGIDPYIAENIRLTSDSALIKWLARHGRIMHKSLSIDDKLQMDILREMELLQCVISFPIMYKGKLIGIFNINNKITGEPFNKGELEVIYMLCNYLATAVKDIDLYHQIQYQKEFTKNILSNMQSGVITINRDEHISLFNQRASEILNINPAEMIGSDLRKLPSPLGDILYETMTEGTSYKRHEIVIQPSKLPLGINSYRLTDEDKNPIGAAIVFADLSDLKRLEEERRKAERLEAINILTGKIAHEIKNPLTAIQTFAQLFDERYGDEEFKNFFTTSVMRSIHQIDNLVDKLVIFSSPLDYRFEKIDINEIIDDAITQAWKDIPPGVSLGRLIKENIKRSVFVSADRRLLTKALYYLILTGAERSPKDESVLIGVRSPEDKNSDIEISIRFSGMAFTDEEKNRISRPLLDMDTFGIELNVPISRKIIEEHGGNIQIRSGDEGNTFVITLPIH